MVQNIQRYISQLGMMVIAVGLSSYNVALFHLVNHAFYKGLLFLGAGAVIHAVADNQDFRKYGGLISFLPLTYSVMLIASLSLVAFPFMTGFYSKDFILESAYGQFNLSSVAVYFIATIGAMFTTLYSVKVLYLTFLTNANGPLINYKRAHEGDMFMSLPLIILAVFSIFFGYITKDMFIGMASGFFSDNSLFTHPLHEIMLETEFAVPTLFKLLPFFLTVILSALSLILSEFSCKSLTYFKLTRMGYNIFSFFNQRLLIELFYNKYITCFILNLGGQTTKVLDKGSIELLGPYGLEKGLLRLSKSLSSLDTGVITSYALFILIGLILYISIPYISLIEISILLCIMSGLLSIAVNMFSLGISSNIQQSHFSVSLFIKNALFKCGSLFVSDKNIISFAGQSPSRLPLNSIKLFSTVPLQTMRRIISSRSYSTDCCWGGHGDNKYIDICFPGVNAVDSNFVFEELAAVLLSEHKYHCHINIRSRINKIPLCKELDTTCIQIGYNIKDIIRVVNDIIIPTLRSYNYKPERVDVMLSLFEMDECDQLSFKYENNSKFRPGYNGTATDIYMPGVNAVDHNILWDEVLIYGSSDHPGILNGFVGVLSEANGRHKFIDPLHYKYITLSLDKQNMPDLAELIANTIKEARTTPEEVWVVLSYWKSDASGGGSFQCKRKSLVPKASQRINRKRSLRHFTSPRKSNVIKNRMYSTINSQQPNQLGIKNKSNWFTYPLFISIATGVGLYLGYRLPLRFMLGELDLLTYYALFNLIVTLCSITIIGNLIGEKINPKRMYLAGFTAIIFTLLKYYFGDFRYKELYASLTYLLAHLPLLGKERMPQGIYISSSLQLKTVEDRSGSGNKSVVAHTKKGANDRPQSEHTNSGTQASSSSGNTADGDKGKNSSYPYNGHMCAKCDSYGIKSATPIGRVCKICGYSLNRYGKIIYKAQNVAFQSDRMEYIANHRHIQKQIMWSKNESLKEIVCRMIDDIDRTGEFAGRMVSRNEHLNRPYVAPSIRTLPKPEPASYKARDEDLPPLGSLKINSDKDLSRLGSDKNIDESIEKNKQKASVDQSSSSQNTVAPSPPSNKTQSPSQPKAAAYVPPLKCPDSKPGSSGGKKS